MFGVVGWALLVVVVVCVIVVVCVWGCWFVAGLVDCCCLCLLLLLFVFVLLLRMCWLLLFVCCV